MKKIPLLIAGTVVLTTMTGCINNSVNRNDVKEYYYVFDIKSESQDYDKIISVLDKSLDYNVVDMSAERPIPSANIPEKPGRFQVVNPFGNTGFAAMAGASAKMATCTGDGMLYKATASKDVGSDLMSITSCLWQYEGGYSLDFYMKVDKGSKSMIGKLASSVAGKITFTPEEWSQAKAFDAVRALEEKAGVKVKLKTGYPRVEGEPWVDGNYKGKGLAG